MNIMYCVNCGNRLEKDASFCKLCGAKILSIDEVATKFCSNCGMKIPQTANFCSKCGIKQNNSEIIKRGTLVNNPDPISLLGLFYKWAFKYDEKTNRRDFWITFFLNFIISLFFYGIWYLIIYVWGAENSSAMTSYHLYSLFTLVMILVSLVWGIWTLFSNISIDIRRLHDINRSGVWLLLAFVPFIGPIILLIMYMQPSKNYL